MKLQTCLGIESNIVGKNHSPKSGAQARFSTIHRPYCYYGLLIHIEGRKRQQREIPL